MNGYWKSMSEINLIYVGWWARCKYLFEKLGLRELVDLL